MLSDIWDGPIINMFDKELIVNVGVTASMSAVSVSYGRDVADDVVISVLSSVVRIDAVPGTGVEVLAAP